MTGAEAALASAAPVDAARRSLARRLLRHRLFMTGVILFGAMVLLALFADVLAILPPEKMQVRLRFRRRNGHFRSAPTISAATSGAASSTARGCRWRSALPS